MFNDKIMNIGTFTQSVNMWLLTNNLNKCLCCSLIGKTRDK